MRGVLISLIILATAAVVLRLIARKLIKARWGYDDYTIVVALV